MQQGVKSSRLVSNLFEGNDKNVPVGRTILTNNPKHNSKGTKPQTEGQPLTSLHIDQFDAFGRSRQQRATKRDDENSEVSFSEREILNDGLIVEAAFDSSSGVLNMVRANGEVLPIDGFLTQPDFGKGATGPKGEPGLEAFDGYDGEDGPDGDPGCEGKEGDVGEMGAMGQAGADGAQGIPGPVGQPGPAGMMGQVGPMGRFGHEGARGPAGLVCEAESGAPGTEGQSVNDSVVISSSEPEDNAVLWGIPE